MKDTVLDILEDLTGSDEVRNDLDIDIFETGLLDSMGTEWNTPNKIIAKVESMQ